MVEKRENRKQLNWMITRDSPHFRKPPNSTNSGRLRIEAVSASYPARSSLLWTWSVSVGSILCKNLRSSCATVFMGWFLSAMDSAAPQSAYIYTYIYIYIHTYIYMYMYIYIYIYMQTPSCSFQRKKGWLQDPLLVVLNSILWHQSYAATNRHKMPVKCKCGNGYVIHIYIYRVKNSYVDNYI